MRKLVAGIAALLYIYVSSSLLVFAGPFSALRGFVIDSLATTRHQYLLKPLSLFLLSDAEIAAHMPHILDTNARVTGADMNVTQDFRNVTDNSIEIHDYTGRTFQAKVMLVHNPNLVKVAVTKDLGVAGQTVSEMVAENHAIAGVNAGAFQDVGWHGTGGMPLGITMHDGKLIGNDQSQWYQQPVIGITDEGVLVAGNYSVAQLKQLHVQEAVSFGPVLVRDGKGLVQGDGGWGLAPRTAIGQTADGTIIFVVTDGRFIHGPDNLGASLKDVQDIMLEYGATIAVNLDGGSSSTMVYDGKLVNQPVDILGERKVATAFIVMPNENRG
ncbi:phosphodiester glycosidase family protein [Alicyclobacillus macrosporangiidus]|uniref:Exopolysaccharide biosynthesis protein n=1 Tax=Alicyclobacillus macrosporangiidus TaxID=392015 RepID=A0A1I7JDD2_9BACL|nr:phosphodiester glycosidase family protein [Alicyclobacillus macrosporangiidus]SFU83210.1 Exopolysaccharide biosynthesis protein [Alicyclobacillus macrosporangiidus]